MLLNEGFLILICDWNPSLQLVVKLELGAVRLLDSDELIVQLGERDAVVVLELGWISREGEDLRDWLLCHFAGNRFLVAKYVASKKVPEAGMKGAGNVVVVESSQIPRQKSCSRGMNAQSTHGPPDIIGHVPHLCTVSAAVVLLFIAQ